jgi:hypothetical protein
MANDGMSQSAKAEDNKDFRRKLSADPTVLKRRGLYSSSKLKSPDMFGKMGLATGRQGAESTPSNAKPGNTQQHNMDSEGSHSVRSNNGNAVSTTPSGNQMYTRQSLQKGRGRFSGGMSGQKWNSDSMSHSSQSPSGQGVSMTPNSNQQYPPQPPFSRS